MSKPQRKRHRHRSLRNLSIRSRIGIALGLLASLIVSMAIISATSMRQAAFLLERADKSHDQMRLTSRLSSDVNAHLVMQIDAMLQGRMTDQVMQSRQRIDQLFEQMRQSHEAEIGLVRDDDERDDEFAELQRLERLRAEVQALFDQAMSSPPLDSSPEATKTRALASQLTARVRDDLQPLIEIVLTDEAEEIAQVRHDMSQLRLDLNQLGLVLGISCVLLAIAAAWHINQTINRPIAAMISATSALSSGNLRQRVPVTRRDELGLLALHFNRMAQHLERHSLQLSALNRDLEQRVAERTESLADSNARLQKIDDSRKRFFANVSHELRTPLTAILGETELCLGDVGLDNPEFAHSLRTINANAAYMRRRVQDLLLLARSEDGELRIETGEVDLARLVDEVCHQVRGLADIEQVDIDIDNPLDVAMAMIDKGWIGQSLMSLIDNAVKFSMRGDTVRVALRQVSDGWQVNILDQGPGFEEKALDHLFDRYYQSEGGRLRGGAGLGLAVAQWVFTEHGGRISARNTEGGACVSCFLPCKYNQV